MRIAFLGKGGSGKTTLSSLFALYMDSQGYTVGLLDVDVNSHTADVVGAAEAPHLSAESSLHDIRRYLVGTNSRITTDELLNTTPPGGGSNFWRLTEKNHLTKRYGGKFGAASVLFTLGSYGSDGIGHSCHHGTQSIAENMLSHVKLRSRDVLVIDSVAGNDSFANSLYYQDLLVFVVKPEREGVSVFARYYELARSAGIASRVRVIGNCVMNETQRSFLEASLPDGLLLGCMGMNETVIAARLNDEPLSPGMLTDDEIAICAAVRTAASQLRRSPQDYYDHIVSLHKTVSAQGWVEGAYRSGLMDQIDTEYRP